MIEKVPVPDIFVEKALNLDDRFLEPGQESRAIEEILRQAQPEGVLSIPKIWYLNPEQMADFKEDFEAPTINRYRPSTEHRLSRYAILQLTLAARKGEPYGLPDQRDGVVVQDIFPRDDLLDKANSSFGATKDFDFHTDQAYNPKKLEVPTYIFLSCIRNDERAPTTIASLPDVIVNLSKQVIAQLCQPDFQFFKGRPEDELGVRTGPILIKRDIGFSIRLGSDVLGANDDANQALKRLRESIARLSQDVILEPGQTLVSPNKTTPHARRAFEPDSDPQKRRWLQRIFVKPYSHSYAARVMETIVSKKYL